MSKRNTISLSSDERSFLDNLIRTGSVHARTQTRARILLMTDTSFGNHKKDVEIAEALMINVVTVVRVRKRFVEEGMDAAIYDKPRPGRAPKITGDVEARLVALACSNPPDGHSAWTLQLLADKLIELKLVESISYVAVHKRLKKTLSNPGK
jgi:putative transposase